MKVSAFRMHMVNARIIQMRITEVSMVKTGANQARSPKPRQGEIRCFKVLGGTRRRYARIGDVIVASVREATPDATPPVQPGHLRFKQLVRPAQAAHKPHLERSGLPPSTRGGR